MSNRSQIEKKVDAALDSLDGMHRAEPAPWFFTRVNARLQRQAVSSWEVAGRFLSRPAVAIAGVIMIVAMNIVFLVRVPAGNTRQAEQTFTENESIIASSSSFDYEKIGQ